MPLSRTDFVVTPETPLEWERFFTEISVTADAVPTGTIESGAVDEPAIASDAVTTTKIANNNVTLSKVEQISADRILGRLATTGDIEQLTATQVRDLLFTQQANITDANTAHALNATFSDTEVEAALDALGAKINAILAALDALNLTA